MESGTGFERSTAPNRVAGVLAATEAVGSAFWTATWLSGLFGLASLWLAKALRLLAGWAPTPEVRRWMQLARLAVFAVVPGFVLGAIRVTAPYGWGLIVVAVLGGGWSYVSGWRAWSAHEGWTEVGAAWVRVLPALALGAVLAVAALGISVLQPRSWWFHDDGGRATIQTANGSPMAFVGVVVWALLALGYRKASRATTSYLREHVGRTATPDRSEAP